MEHIAIGQTVMKSYGEEQRLMQDWNGLASVPRIQDRINELRNRQGINGGAFLPSTTPNNDILKLRTDFAYWKSGYSPEFDHSIAVLLTAASMLQYAREL